MKNAPPRPSPRFRDLKGGTTTALRDGAHFKKALPSPKKAR